MTVGLAIFVKTPGCSPVKTRLAADGGRAYAESWYRRAADAVASVARVAAEKHGIAVYWAVAEPAAIASDAWSGLPVLAQGEGGLGERMARVHAALVAMHGAGVLIGADAPQLTADQLGECAAWLRQPAPRLSMGPARDGGFWLFGGNVVPPMAAWQQARYSTSSTARDLRLAMADCGEWLLLPEFTDVDRAEDLDSMLREFASQPVLLPEQQQLIDWMRSPAARVLREGLLTPESADGDEPVAPRLP